MFTLHSVSCIKYKTFLKCLLHRTFYIWILFLFLSIYTTKKKYSLVATLCENIKKMKKIADRYFTLNTKDYRDVSLIIDEAIQFTSAVLFSGLIPLKWATLYSSISYYPFFCCCRSSCRIRCYCCRYWKKKTEETLQVFFF